MYAFFIIFSIINKFLMTPIVRLSAEKDRREGNLRFKHSSIRMQSENFAFYGPDSCTELSRTNGYLTDLLDTQRSLYNRQFWLNLATNVFVYTGSIASFLVIAMPIFAGYYDSLTEPELSQLISENAFVCINLIAQLSKLVRMSTTVSAMAGVTHRIMELVEVMKRADNHSNNKRTLDLESIITFSSTSSSSSSSSSVLLSLTNLSISAPKCKSVLIKRLRLDLVKGQHLLIMGQSSSGKTSLLRTLRGLWPADSGEIRVGASAAERGFFFLPQKVYLSEGSLADQIVYPLSHRLSLTEERDMIHLANQLGKMNL